MSKATASKNIAQEEQRRQESNRETGLRPISAGNAKNIPLPQWGYNNNVTDRSTYVAERPRAGFENGYYPQQTGSPYAAALAQASAALAQASTVRQRGTIVQPLAGKELPRVGSGSTLAPAETGISLGTASVPGRPNSRQRMQMLRPSMQYMLANTRNNAYMDALSQAYQQRLNEYK